MIVDDGSHNPTYQMDALNYLWEALKPGGVYIIEVGREAQCTALYCLALYCSVLCGRALALGLCARHPGDPSALPCLAFPCSGHAWVRLCNAPGMPTTSLRQQHATTEGQRRSKTDPHTF